MSIEKPTAIELQFQAQSLQRTGAKLEATLLANGKLMVQLTDLAKENGKLNSRLHLLRYILVAVLLAWALRETCHVWLDSLA